MDIDRETGEILVERIEKRLPNLPAGRFWNKYGKTKISYHVDSRSVPVDNDFHIDFSSLPIRLVDFNGSFWLPQLAVDSETELMEVAEEIFYDMFFPLTESIPVQTTFEMKTHRRFESTIISEDDDYVTVNPIPMNIQAKLKRDDFKQIVQTGRQSKEGEDIYRFVLKYNRLDQVLDRLLKISEEADSAFMAELARKTFGH